MPFALIHKPFLKGLQPTVAIIRSGRLPRIQQVGDKRLDMITSDLGHVLRHTLSPKEHGKLAHGFRICLWSS